MIDRSPLSSSLINEQPMPDDRILLIEDAQAPRSFMSRALAKIGSVVHARTLLEGSVQLATMAPKAIVIGWKLPDGSAIDGISELRSVQDDVPILVVSPDLPTEQVVSIMRAGAYDVLPNPVKEDDLQLAVLRAIRMAKTESKRLAEPMENKDDDDGGDGEFSVPLGTPLRVAEEKLIDATLAFCNGSIPACAQVLGISASTLYRKLEARKNAK